MTKAIFSIILAGGSGTRLWPLSRTNYPKQFLCLQGQQSLFQQTIARVSSLSLKKTLIVTNEAHYFLCQEQTKPHHSLTYLLEPGARNTAPAIAAAAHYLNHHVGPDALMLILPSDHALGDSKRWREAMLEGAALASEEDVIVTFGIKPQSPKTGYGYIKARFRDNGRGCQVLSFHEKPDKARAEQMVQEGTYYWNSGMFICRAQIFLKELERYAPDIFAASHKAFAQSTALHDFIRLEEEAYAECRKESIDYAIMEHTQDALMLPLDIPWSDLGCWVSVADANEADALGNNLSGNVIAKESYNCLIRSEQTLVTALGIKDQIIVATSDAILVADKKYTQQVKELVENLRENHPRLLEEHTRVSRPWGYYEILAEGPAFKVKRLMVHPGASLSLQMHQHRAEHWVVVAGEADIINGEKHFRLSVNQSTYIPKQTRHRLSNKGDTALFVIEVQSGAYLGEDDIQRLDDIYSRKLETQI